MHWVGIPLTGHSSQTRKTDVDASLECPSNVWALTLTETNAYLRKRIDSLPEGASIYDVRKILEILDPPFPLHPHL